MKIAVLVKQTPDTETKAKLTDSGLDTNGVKFIMNPYDEFAVEEAIQLKEKSSGEAVVVSLGPDRVVEAMRTALAMGCDSGIHIKVDDAEIAKFDSFAVSKAIAETLKDKGFDLVLAGKQAIDDDALAVPQMVAEFLGWGRATVVTGLEIADKNAKAKRAVDGGAEESVEFALPAVVAAHKGLNTPRYASLPGIMKAKQKKIDVVEASSVGVSADTAKVSYENFELPPEKAPGKIFKGEAPELAQQIAEHLRNEAKVL